MPKVYKPIKHLHTKLRGGIATTWVLFTLLLGLFAFWNISRETGSLVVWCFQSIPLLALAPGMFKKNYRSYSWMCFVLLFYFIFAVERSMISTSTFTDYLFLALVVALFLATMMTSRWLQRSQKQHLLNPKEIEANV
ncbi:hypothetical protein TDB9533_01410 [Thalassocella blandensis]|nr:hypothetical protein TDB9533_01410 [Thalassocella blandensis]